MLFTGTLEVGRSCVCRGVRLYDDVTVNVTVIKRKAIKREKFPRLPSKITHFLGLLSQEKLNQLRESLFLTNS